MSSPRGQSSTTDNATPKTKKINDLEVENAGLKEENARLRQALERAQSDERTGLDTLADAAAQVNQEDLTAQNTKLATENKDLRDWMKTYHDKLEKGLDFLHKKSRES